jgi:hypothetical protein
MQSSSTQFAKLGPALAPAAQGQAGQFECTTCSFAVKMKINFCCFVVHMCKNTAVAIGSTVTLTALQ